MNLIEALALCKAEKNEIKPAGPQKGGESEAAKAPRCSGWEAHLAQLPNQNGPRECGEIH